ncbi:MAG TPA: CYTH and CHAD domain-containing protein [Jatrophihabitans sp.]|nr:CYTH and CHAD domain-containing protein [Jatrophihabitans sp.]
MAESYLEREDKFDVEPGFELPALGAVDQRVTELRSERHELRSQYFDTPDRALLAAAMTLRRRTGTTDTGWQLKVPKEPAREEIRVDSQDESPPAELVALLAGVRRGQDLVPLATLEVTRLATTLVDAQGQVLAEVADDTVRSWTEPGQRTDWREVEVELGPAGDELLLARVGKQLRRGGASRSAGRSKLARAVGEVAPVEDLLGAYLLEQQRAMLSGDLALRRSDAGAIHKTRVGIRRYRSTLRTFLDREAGRALDEELRWLAGVLGEIRDRQVMRPRLLALVDQLPDPEVLGPVRARIEMELDREQAEAWRAAQQVLRSQRYAELLAAVDSFRLSLHPVPGKRLAKLMHRAERKVDKRLRRAGADPARLHRARKAAKRARYAGELVAPSGLKAAAKQAARNQALQDALGEHQDSLVTAETLYRLGLVAGTTPTENGFTFGLLYEREREIAAGIRARLVRGTR